MKFTKIDTIMKKYLQIIITLLVVIPSLTSASETDAIAQSYFTAWNASQSPGATEDDLNAYLSLLTAGVGHQAIVRLG